MKHSGRPGDYFYLNLGFNQKDTGSEIGRENWATKQTLTTFHYTGWFIGILVMVYYNPYKTGYCSIIPYITQPTRVFFIAQLAKQQSMLPNFEVKTPLLTKHFCSKIPLMFSWMTMNLAIYNDICISAFKHESRRYIWILNIRLKDI